MAEISASKAARASSLSLPAGAEVAVAVAVVVATLDALAAASSPTPPLPRVSAPSSAATGSDALRYPFSTACHRGSHSSPAAAEGLQTGVDRCSVPVAAIDRNVSSG
jgi:hypothetical protein